ncbi:nuclear receptor 2C2-associated protein isoform X1 [Rana temporaria]|uniref:nuclear receptor 2C2-associated protein isoform X1 n=1 Tax=Rana temporaria TaxID=8407 RepID=UPI001AADC756|nr:nuclear receptor 2C2-associated protein isoform X1 [Rana temporaria]
MVESVICPGTVSRVSSVLQRDVKQFGKQFLFDHRDETCWNSDQGSSQWIVVEFPQKVCVSEIHIQFQGGFSSKNCILEGCLKNEELETVTDFYPEDINALQKFVFTERCVERLRLSFPSSTDFFGRIVVYHLDVRGCKL